MKSRLGNLMRFVAFLHKFQKLERKILVTGSDRDENDLEHSAQLALTAWYVVSSQKLNLDLNLILKYCLAHDLVETYAGDTYFYDQAGRATKIGREQQALKRISQEFSEFGELVKLIKKYEKKLDEESKFVYALDKVLPVLNIFLDNGKSWKRDGVTLERLVVAKTPKVKKSSEINKYFEEIVKLLKNNQDKLFPKLPH